MIIAFNHFIILHISDVYINGSRKALIKNILHTVHELHSLLQNIYITIIVIRDLS